MSSRAISIERHVSALMLLQDYCNWKTGSVKKPINTREREQNSANKYIKARNHEIIFEQHADNNIYDRGVLYRVANPGMAAPVRRRSLHPVVGDSAKRFSSLESRRLLAEV
ncbi:hypothetical protein PUN28_002166 [Cardiocondyla obscurior]|uniref:Uncharacterized protein n=1 Tax=Cardiocondyla obscurior TaxID=286306 RepID=A0AAW2GSZ0_9HYME